MEKNVLAVVPAYNEEDRIENTIKNIQLINNIDDIVVIDDGSTDNTSQKVRDMGIKLIRLDSNHGKGYAIKKAIEKMDFKYLVLVDGDLGNTSNEVEKLIKPVIDNETDVTIARFQKPKKKGGFGLVKSLARYGVYFYTGRKLTSTLSGQRVYKKEVVEKISYIPNRYGIEVAMTVATLQNGYRIKEIDVNMSHRETGRDLQGFVHRGKQFWDIIKTLIILLYRR